MKDQPILMGKKGFYQKGVTAVLMVRMKKSLWGTGKVVVMDMDSVFCVLEGLISMVAKDVLDLASINKRHYWFNEFHQRILFGTYKTSRLGV